MNAYQQFIYEINRIEKWYLTTIHSYKEVSLELEKNIEHNIEIENDTYTSPVLLRTLKIDNQKICKDLAIVRSISAFEVFLVSNIKEIFEVNKSPFKSSNIVENQMQEILSMDNITDLHNKIIEKICRQLHSAGLDTIKKYYKKTFDVNFPSFSYTENEKNYYYGHIEKMHMIRHLLVHRLGKTDNQFKNKYNYEFDEILLESEDIIYTLEELKFFASYLMKNLEVYYPVNLPDDTVIIEIEILSSLELSFLAPEFIIRKNKDRPKLSEILVEIRELNDNHKEIILDGDYSLIRKYYKKLLKYELKGFIKVIKFKNNRLFINNRKVNIKDITAEEIKSVLNRLPEGSWEKGIHKIIAGDLGFSNNRVSKIISILKEDENITLKLSKSSLILNIGQTEKLEAIINSTNSSGRYISWTSKDSNIAIVNEGVVKGISEGETEIIVKANANCYKKCKVCVQ